MVLTSIFFYGKIEAKRGIIVAKVSASKGISYVEYGYIIKPLVRLNASEGVKYPFKNTFMMPKGYQLSGAKSQNDASRFDTFDDVIRIYALVPYNEKEQEEVEIYVFPTGLPFTAPDNLQKLTIVKEYDGELIFHIYFKCINKK